MNLENCSLEDVGQLAEWHQKQAKIAKQSIPKLVSQHYQHLLHIETKPLQWIPIDAKSVPHSKDSFIDFIINSILHQRHWIKHFQRDIQLEICKRCLSIAAIETTHSLFPQHQSTIDLFLALILLNKWSLSECFQFVLNLVQTNGLQLVILLNTIKWFKLLINRNELPSKIEAYKEFIPNQSLEMPIKVTLTANFHLSNTAEQDPIQLYQLLKDISNETQTSSCTLEIRHINDLLKCAESEILHLLKQSTHDSWNLFDTNTNIQDWDVFAKELSQQFNCDYFLFKDALNNTIREWSNALLPGDLYKLYFKQPMIRDFIELPTCKLFDSVDQQPWVFELVSPCRFPYLPCDVQLNGYRSIKMTTYQEDADFPITTFPEFQQIPIVRADKPVLDAPKPLTASSSFSKSMSFQKPSLFKYAKSIFD